VVKKVLGLVAVASLMTATAGYAGLITWGFTGDLGVSYNGYLVELVEDVGKDGFSITTLWDDHTITGGDEFISTPIQATIAGANKGAAPYQWGASFTSPGASLTYSDNIYTVIYNASTFGAATQYQIVDATPYVLPAGDAPADYLSSTVSGSWAPIVAVPEPGSMILFGLGVATLALRRRKRG